MKFLKSLIATAFAFVLIAGGTGTAFAADAAHVSLSAPGSANVGTSFTVTIAEDSGATTINLVTVTLSYNASQLQFVGFDDSTSEFAYKDPSNAGGSGSVSVKRGLYSQAYTGKHTVVGVTFKALAGSGTASVALTSARVTNPQNGADVWDKSLTAASIALNTPAPAPSQPSNNDNNGGSQQQSNPQSSSNNTSSNSNTAQAGNDESTAANSPADTKGEVKSDDTTKQAPKSDDKKAPKKSSSNVFYWILGILIVLSIIGALVRRFVSAQPMPAAAPVAKTPVASTSQKPAAGKKPASNKNKKNNRVQ